MDEQNTPPTIQPEVQTAPAIPESAPAAPLTQTPVVDLSSNRGMAILAYLGILIIVPFVTGAQKDPFVKFHIKQGLSLIIAWIGIGILSSILSFVFSSTAQMAYLSSSFFSFVYLLLFLINVLGLINAATGKTKALPVIGGLSNIFNF